AIYSLQSKKLIADFLVNDYKYYNYVSTNPTGYKNNKFDMILIHNNQITENRKLFKEYIYNICNDKLVRIKIKNIYRYGFSEYTLALLKTTPLLVEADIGNKNNSVVFNFNVNKEYIVPFNIVSTINDMYCVNYLVLQIQGFG
ncbi:MAG: hypothetical protein ACP5RD_08555, partial [bacterium]